MKLLDALMPSRSTYGMGFQDYVDNLVAYQGSTYPLGLTTTWGMEKAEPVDANFTGYVLAGLKSSASVWALETKRIQVISQARFQYQQMRAGRPGDLFGTGALDILERPWPGGTTGDLIARALLHADFAGNAWIVQVDGEMVLPRPDWVEIILEPRRAPYGVDGGDVTVGMRQVGILYYHGGKTASTADAAVFLPGEYGHFAPYPDPLATYRGMSWLTPVVREIQADSLATRHKLKFFENAATPNIAVSLPKEITPAQFELFVQKMDGTHRGTDNAYKTLYTAGGADVTVIGADMKQLDFKTTQGAGETRLAAAAGVHPVIVGFSEGMAGSALNAGNYTSAKRSFVDTTCRHAWQNLAGSLAPLVPPPTGSRLWYDARDIPFLTEDLTDRAEIQFRQAQTIRALTDAGYTAESVVAAVMAEDMSLLRHSGLFSVQLQPPGSGEPAPAPEETP